MNGFYYAYAWDSTSEFQLTSEVMPVTMKNMEATNNKNLLSFASGWFSNPPTANIVVFLTWILQMELTKYEWPAIKYLKSQDVTFMKEWWFTWD